jgi:Ca2+-binding EF-hand superfamily protein
MLQSHHYHSAIPFRIAARAWRELPRSVLLSTCLLCAAVAPAWSQESPVQRVFQELDEDGNGYVDRSEFLRRKIRLMNAHDTDDDDYITADETEVTQTEFNKADVNGDGRLSGLEWIDAHFTDFDAVDENADGKLTVEELDAFAILVFKKGAQ